MKDDVIVFDLTIHKGADYTVDFEILEDDDTNINVEDFSIESQLREYPEASDKIDFTCTADEDGFHLSMDYSDTQKIPYTQGYYDVFIQPENGLRSKLAEGKVKIVKDVTR